MSKTKNTITNNQFHQVIYIFLLLINVQICIGRSQVARPYVPSDYHFARKIIQPCGVARSLLESVTREEVINMVEIVYEDINETKLNMVSFISNIKFYLIMQ